MLTTFILRLSSNMSAVREMLGSGLTKLRSIGSRFNSTLLFDSLAVPFSDVQLGSSSSSSAVPQSSDERIVYLNANGRELSQGEVEEYVHSGLNDSPWGFVASRYALTLGIMVSTVLD
jgi:hypothetical protein